MTIYYNKESKYYSSVPFKIIFIWASSKLFVQVFDGIKTSITLI